MNKLKNFLAGMLFCLTGCSSVTPADYAGRQEPKLDIREYLNGKLEARGVLIDYMGKADKSFYIAMVGTWNGNEGTLEEDFTYNDGTKDYRTWKIHVTDDNQITGTAGDVLGEAHGSQGGNALNMHYSLRAKRDNGGTIDLTMNDWMYRLSDTVLLNRIRMYKFGIPVGELNITFNKLPN